MIRVTAISAALLVLAGWPVSSGRAGTRRYCRGPLVALSERRQRTVRATR